MQLQPPTFSQPSESSGDKKETQIEDAVAEAIAESDDKIIEIRPANESKGRGKFSMLALMAGVIAVGYWLRKSRKPTEMIQNAASETADRTREMTEQAAETIEESGETAAERVEEGSQKASEQVEHTGEIAAEETEEAGEMAAEKTE